MGGAGFPDFREVEFGHVQAYVSTEPLRERIDMKTIGLSCAEICCDYYPFSFIICNNHPYQTGRMRPIYFSAEK
jgi:hypothetical protein